MPFRPSVFGTDQEVDQPQPSSSKMHLIDVSDTNSSSDKADTKVPQSVNSTVRDDALHQKVDALTTLLTDFKPSQNQDALVKEIAALKDRVAALKNRDIILHLDNQIEKVISDSLAHIDNNRQSEAANMMKTAQMLLSEVEKCHSRIPELMTVVDNKITSTTDHLSTYLHGVVSENISLRRTHFLLL
ncbi:hypothetical protein L1887_17826 [Cichorium endivia]|nr:hypothetical protein L1887_17826 [Cichorium endivia]